MISVIIPIYNEAGYLPATLDSIADNKPDKEMIVVDAGSADGISGMARERASSVLFSPRRQRAYQMNLGAKRARGCTLLFLHADTRLPALALDQIESVLSEDEIVGGGFARRYDSSSWFLRTTCLLAGLRTRWTGWFLGDQGIFVRRETFEKLGGFRDLELFEDLDFSMRMAQTGKVVTLSPPVISSSRRFKRRGEFSTTLSDAWLTCRYLAGADPNALANARRASAAESPSSSSQVWHAVLVCAARSCPPLQRFAYAPSHLDEQIDTAYRSWLARDDLNRFFPDQRKGELSSIFDWFKDDFDKAEWLKLKYAPQHYQDFLTGGNYEVSYMPYNWGLNDQGDHGKDYSDNQRFWDSVLNFIQFWK